MRIYSNLPEALFPEIYSTAVYIANRTPVKELGWKTLYEAVFGIPPLVYHLRVYGCWAYPLLKGPNTLLRKEKLQPRAYIGYLVGYDALNIFRVWIPSRNKVIRTRDVIFDEQKFFNLTELDLGNLIKEPIECIINVLLLVDLTELELD
jgi:hypothetical protein